MGGGAVTERTVAPVDNSMSAITSAYLSLPDGTQIGAIGGPSRSAFMNLQLNDQQMNVVGQAQGGWNDSLDRILESAVEQNAGQQEVGQMSQEMMNNLGQFVGQFHGAYANAHQNVHMVDESLHFNSMEFVGNINLDPLGDAVHMVINFLRKLEFSPNTVD